MTTKLTARRTGPRRVHLGRRKTTWIGITVFGDGITNTAVASGVLLDMRTTADRILIGGTILRIHGVYGVRATGSTNLSAASLVSHGLIVVQGDASDIGVTALPEPLADADASWMWHQDIIVQGLGTNSAMEMQSGLIDVKSKRKLLANMTLVHVVTNQANATIDSLVAIRILVGLP